MPRVSIQSEDFDLGAEVAALRADDTGVGAVASFIGTVRERSEGQVVSEMELEHYPGMTERSIEAMIDEAHRRFDIRAARVVHRVGVLAAGAQIMLFSTGRGSPAGSPLAPVVKITSNTRLFERMPDDMDFDAGRAVAGRSLDELGADLRDLVVAVANGRVTKPELTRTELFAINSTSEPF
jgi:hypothetical protein